MLGQLTELGYSEVVLLHMKERKEKSKKQNSSVKHMHYKTTDKLHPAQSYKIKETQLFQENNSLLLCPESTRMCTCTFLSGSYW